MTRSVYFYSRFIFPASVMCLIATVNYPHGLGQFMAGQVGGTTYLINAKRNIFMYSRQLVKLFSSFDCHA